MRAVPLRGVDAPKRIRPASDRRAEAVRYAVEPSVAAIFGVDVCDLRSSRRGSPQVAFARQVAMYLGHVVCRLSLSEIGTVFARDRSTVAHACGLVVNVTTPSSTPSLIIWNVPLSRFLPHCPCHGHADETGGASR